MNPGGFVKNRVEQESKQKRIYNFQNNSKKYALVKIWSKLEISFGDY